MGDMDNLSPTERSAQMARVRAKGSRPEMAVRRLVHALGYRFRLHRRDLPGTPDLVLPRHRKVIFVHGCFWHRHSDPACKLARLPKSNVEFWTDKLERNRTRDVEQQERLTALGWQNLVVWECELRQTEQVVNKVRAFLERERKVAGC